MNKRISQKFSIKNIIQKRSPFKKNNNLFVLCMKENEAQTNLPSMFLGLFSQRHRHLREKGEEAGLRAADLFDC